MTVTLAVIGAAIVVIVVATHCLGSLAELIRTCITLVEAIADLRSALTRVLRHSPHDPCTISEGDARCRRAPEAGKIIHGRGGRLRTRVPVLTWIGGVVAAWLTLVVYWIRVGYRVNDALGWVGAIVGSTSLVLAVSGLAREHRQNPQADSHCQHGR